MSGEPLDARMGDMSSSRYLRRAVVVSLLAGAFAAVALPASAHAELVSSDPADGSTVNELATIHFEFSEDLLDIGNSVVVSGGDGVKQDAVLTYPKANQIDAAVTGVAPGAVTISWRNASVDGHTEEGVLHVTLLAPSPSPSPTPTPTVTVTATATPSASVTPSVSPTAVPADGSTSGVSPWLWALLGLVVIGGTAAALVASTRRPPHEE